MVSAKRTSLFQLALIAVLFVITFFAGITLFKRWRLPYNTEGRYFDEATGIVYHQQSVTVYLIFTILMIGLLAGTIIWMRKTVAR